MYIKKIVRKKKITIFINPGLGNAWKQYPNWLLPRTKKAWWADIDGVYNTIKIWNEREVVDEIKCFGAPGVKYMDILALGGLQQDL